MSKDNRSIHEVLVELTKVYRENMALLNLMDSLIADILVELRSIIDATYDEIETTELTGRRKPGTDDGKDGDGKPPKGVN